MRIDGLVISPVTYVELAPVFDGDTARQEYLLYHLEVSWTEVWTRAAVGKSGALAGGGLTKAIQDIDSRSAVRKMAGMSTLTLEVPEDTFASLPFPPADFARSTLLAACVKWVEAGRLTQSRASEICRVSREAFLREMSSYAVSPFQESPAEMKEALTRG